MVEVRFQQLASEVRPFSKHGTGIQNVVQPLSTVLMSVRLCVTLYQRIVMSSGGDIAARR
jgi:hypothetical protein